MIFIYSATSEIRSFFFKVFILCMREFETEFQVNGFFYIFFSDINSIKIEFIYYIGKQRAIR